jgi:glycerophosphoryl diester phosphodiesterase
VKQAGRRLPLVVGHRGAAARAPENTAASFRAALDADADAVEFDVGLSADGRAVVLHDATLDRTTNGRGRLSEKTWEELSRLDAGGWFSPRFAGEPLLDLDGALAMLRGRAGVIVEIKAGRGEPRRDPGPAGARLVEEVVAALGRSGGFEGATVSSSCRPLLAAAASAAPGLDLALVVPPWHAEDPVAAARRIGASALHPNRRLCTRRFVERAMSAGLEVVPYVVNRARELDRLIAVGVHGVFTDDPEAIRRLLARRKPERLPDDGR